MWRAGAVRGEAHYQPGNPDAAIADFRKTLELQPAQADAALARERLAELAPGSWTASPAGVAAVSAGCYPPPASGLEPRTTRHPSCSPANM